LRRAGVRNRSPKLTPELALIYWRTGENNEARDLLHEALSLLSIDSDLKAKTVIRLAVVEFRAARHEKALRILRRHKRLFDKIQNHTLKGSYHDTLGNALEDLSVLKRRADYVDDALIEYAVARLHFEKAGHNFYLAALENNLGMLHFRTNRHDEAHKHLDLARRMFTNLKEVSLVGQVDETRASVFLKQGRIAEAEKAARAAVRIQEKTSRHGLVAEALTTLGRALARLERYGAALSAFQRAISLYERLDCMKRAAEVALAMVQEMREHLAASDDGQLLSGRGVGKDKLALEHNVIKLALIRAEGRVSEAASLAGMSWQGLAYALRTRHKDLLKYRIPMRPRARRKRRS
jgi:tetratricopeptide (TPR) repeat protein